MPDLAEVRRQLIHERNVASMQDMGATAGRSATEVMYGLFGATAEPVVTGISRPRLRPICKECGGSGVDGMSEEDCPMCAGTGYRKRPQGLDDYSEGFIPEGPSEFLDEAA